MRMTRDCRERHSTVPTCASFWSTYRSLNALSAKWCPSFALVVGSHAVRRTLSVSSAIRHRPRGGDCSTPTSPIRPRKESTSLSADAHTVLFVTQESLTFALTQWSMFSAGPQRATYSERLHQQRSREDD